MQSVTGQAKNEKREKGLSSFLHFFKDAQAAKANANAQNELFAALLSAKSETDAFRKNLDLVTDEEAKEYCIYRLKAAELNLNRHIKLAKKQSFTYSPFQEDAL